MLMSRCLAHTLFVAHPDVQTDAQCRNPLDGVVMCARDVRGTSSTDTASHEGGSTAARVCAPGVRGDTGGSCALPLGAHRSFPGHMLGRVNLNLTAICVSLAMDVSVAAEG